MLNNRSIILAFKLDNSYKSKYFSALSSTMINKGYPVIVITPGKMEDKVLSDSSTVIYTWPSQQPTKIIDAIFLSKVIKKHKPFMILANFEAVNISMIVSWLMRVPFRFAYYHTSFNNPLLKVNFIVKYQVMRKALVYKFATMVMTVSSAMEYELQKIYAVPKQKIKLFYNAIEDHKIRNSLRDPHEKSIICVGGFKEGKGQDVLLKAMPKLLAYYPGLKLTLVGGGETETKIRDLVNELNIKDSVIFTGWISRLKEILFHVANADIAIVPSLYEAFPYVVVEAMSVGVPVIASNVGGIPEVIRDGNNGFLVNPDDPNLLAEKILLLLGNDELRKTMGQNARESFLTNFELKKAISKQADWLIEKTLENRN